MPPEIHPHRPLVRTFVACQQVERVGHQITLVGLLEKVRALSDRGHIGVTLYASLTSGQGRHRIQLEYVHFDKTGEEISRRIVRQSIIDMGNDPLEVRGLPMKVVIPLFGAGWIEIHLFLDGQPVPAGTLTLSVR